MLPLVAPAERLGKDKASYSVDFAATHAMPRYPASLLPFPDDTGSNLWAFDYRADPAFLPVAFIDQELDGEEGVTPVARDFSALLARIGVTMP